MKIGCLIVSSIYDFSIDLVITEFENAGTPYLRLNKEDLSKYQINIDPIKKQLKVKGLGIDEVITSIGAIWFRQPVFTRNTPSTALSIEEQLCRSQWGAFLRSLMVFSDSFWMNWPANTYSAESKPYQLMIASKVGFDIPETQVGNDVNSFSNFEENIIVKSLDTVLLQDGEDCLFTYTSNVSLNDLTDEAIRAAPVTVQTYIEPKVDIRVTVVGNEVFTVKILSGGCGIEEDWRLTEKENLEYVDLVLPKEIEVKCRNIVSELGLNYGAIDLIESNDKFYFIEINPTGEWGWLSSPKRPIEKSISSLLSGIR